MHVQLSCVMRICHSHIFIYKLIVFYKRELNVSRLIAIYNQIFLIFLIIFQGKKAQGWYGTCISHVSWGHIHLRKFANIVIIKFIWRQFSCFELRCSSSLYCSFKDIFWKGTSAKINRSKGNRSFVSDSTWLYNWHCPSSECPH